MIVKKEKIMKAVKKCYIRAYIVGYKSAIGVTLNMDESFNKGLKQNLENDAIKFFKETMV